MLYDVRIMEQCPIENIRLVTFNLDSSRFDRKTLEPFLESRLIGSVNLNEWLSSSHDYPYFD